MHPLIVPLLVLVAVAGLTWLVIYRSRPRPEKPKYFGLKEAEAAAQYIFTTEMARPVMGVVVGVLGYEDKVAEDLRLATLSAAAENEYDREQIADFEDRVRNLQASVTRLEAEMDDRAAVVAEKERVAALFNTAS